MIRIEIDSDTKDKFKEIHWNWFKARMDEVAWPEGKTHKEFIL